MLSWQAESLRDAWLYLESFAKGESVLEIKDQVFRDWSWKRIVQHFQLKHRLRSTGTIILRCVFHQERTPSLVFSEESKRFKCYGCSRGGDVFEFLFYFLDAHSLDDLMSKLGHLERRDIKGQFVFPFMSRN